MGDVLVPLVNGGEIAYLGGDPLPAACPRCGKEVELVEDWEVNNFGLFHFGKCCGLHFAVSPKIGEVEVDEDDHGD